MVFSRPSSPLDVEISARIMNICWICASLGTTVLQLHLLALVWHQSRQATEVALIASAWILGTGISAPRAPRAARVWGGLLAGSSLLMLFLPLSPAHQL